jgi:RNA recognition motif-containing protein
VLGYGLQRLSRAAYDAVLTAGLCRKPSGDEEGVAMQNRLFVGGLSWGTTDEGLAAAFAKAGEVLTAVVETEVESGRPRGFGFVTFATEKAAGDAVRTMDGMMLDGRRIHVRIAREPAKLEKST